MGKMDRWTDGTQMVEDNIMGGWEEGERGGGCCGRSEVGSQTGGEGRGGYRDTGFSDMK